MYCNRNEVFCTPARLRVLSPRTALRATWADMQRTNTLPWGEIASTWTCNNSPYFCTSYGAQDTVNVQSYYKISEIKLRVQGELQVESELQVKVNGRVVAAAHRCDEGFQVVSPSGACLLSDVEHVREHETRSFDGRQVCAQNARISEYTRFVHEVNTVLFMYNCTCNTYKSEWK